MRSTDDLSKRWKLNRWKLRVEVTCKGRSVYEERLKSVELSRAWSFYLSNSSSLSGTIRPLGLLRTSTSNIYLNLKSSTSTSALIPNGLLASSLASSWYIRTILIRFMIPDVHLQRSLHLIKSGLGLRTCRAWGPLVYYQGLCYSCRSDFPEDEADVCIKEKSLAASSRAFIYTDTKGCSRVIRFTPQRVGDVLEEVTYHKLVVPSIK